MQNQTIYGAVFLFVVGFTYFYATIVFQPERVSENFAKTRWFYPGIRPGAQTAAYLLQVVERITQVVHCSWLYRRYSTHRSGPYWLDDGEYRWYILLIVVSVVIESIKQIEAQITMRSYDVYWTKPSVPKIRRVLCLAFRFIVEC